jgi:hypothetical protein
VTLYYVIILKFFLLPICVLHTILTVDKDYFPKWYEGTDFVVEV